MLATMPNKVSPICQYIKSVLLFLTADTAMQIAESRENMLPTIKYVCIKITSADFLLAQIEKVNSFMQKIGSYEAITECVGKTAKRY
jgi:hypothetical protein